MYIERPRQGEKVLGHFCGHKWLSFPPLKALQNVNKKEDLSKG